MRASYIAARFLLIYGICESRFCLFFVSTGQATPQQVCFAVGAFSGFTDSLCVLCVTDGAQ
ncbi:hypothetical protein WQ77_26070, partial [Escherichia coli]